MSVTLNYSDAAQAAMGDYLAALRAHRQQAGRPGADDRLTRLDDLCDAFTTQLLRDNPEVAGDDLPLGEPRPTSLFYSPAAAGKVGLYIGLHRHLRESEAYSDPERLRQLQAAGVAALHAILQGNPQTGFAAMIEQCNALERDRLERAA